MKKADKKKLLYLISVSLIFFLVSCVDTNITNIPETINYQSQVSVANLAADVGSATVKLNAQSGSVADFGAVAFGTASAYKLIPAGNKTLAISYSGGAKDNGFKLFTDVDYKIRLILVGDNTAREVIKVIQRNYNSTKKDTSLFPAGYGQVTFFNGSPQDTLNSVDVITGGDTTNHDLSGLVMGEGSGTYLKLKTGSYKFDFMVGSGANKKIVSVSQNLSDMGRYTAVIYDNHSSLKSKVFTDD